MWPAAGRPGFELSYACRVTGQLSCPGPERTWADALAVLPQGEVGRARVLPTAFSSPSSGRRTRLRGPVRPRSCASAHRKGLVEAVGVEGRERRLLPRRPIGGAAFPAWTASSPAAPGESIVTTNVATMSSSFWES